MHQVDFIEHFAEWFHDHSESLRQSGIEARFGRSEGQRQKHSAWITCERGPFVAEVMGWDTGETEFMSGKARSAEEVNEHREITNLELLNALLGRVLAAVQTE